MCNFPTIFHITRNKQKKNIVYFFCRKFTQEGFLMKCKNWSNKINNFVVRRLKSFKINGQQQVLSTMPAMPKEKTSPIPLSESNFTEMKMKEQLGSSASKLIGTKAAEEILSSSTGTVVTAKNLSCSGCSSGCVNVVGGSNDITSTKYQTVSTNGTANLINTTSTTTTQQQSYQTNNKINYTTMTATTNNTMSAAVQNNFSVNDKKNSIITNGVNNTTTGCNTTQGSNTGVPPRRSAKDYVFGKYIGEGSFSTVYLAKDVTTNKEYAIKVCDKQHILREKKQEYVRREREVMHIMNNIPGFVNLSCTFQDYRSLYFVMTYAKNGDMLPYINKVGSFDLDCTRHYAAELVLAMEHMHKRGIVHRDLKPENILLDENMHTLIADFGSAKILGNDKDITIKKDTDDDNEHQHRRRKGSFVGTAQYVSPEVLQGNTVTRSVDLWALGCIIYQMISGLPPFRGGSDYLIFKEIMNLNLVFPEGFDKNAEDLVRSLLKINSEERIGAQDKLGRYESIRTHPFFEGINWDTVRYHTPPPIYPYLPGVCKDEELRSQYRVPDNLEPGLDDRQLTRLLGLDLGTESKVEIEKKTEPQNNFDLSESEKQKRLEAQKSDRWDAFAEGEVILKKGFINKRKGLFARKRMLLLTTGPRLIYIDPVQMIKKGEIPWSPELRVEPKNFKIFFVHTPNRTYYLEDPEGYALEWVDAIEDVRQKTYGDKS